MAQVYFKQAKISVNVQNGSSLLDAARTAGVTIESPCNGSGTCGKCRVIIAPDSYSHLYQKAGEGTFQEPGYVLACQSRVMDDVTVDLIPDVQNKDLKILNDGQSMANVENPYITKKYNYKLHSTVIYAGGELLGTESGNTERKNYGIIVDIGTTTLVVSLVDVAKGQELFSESSLNPQAAYAHDVLSRIQFATENNGLLLLYQGVIQEVNRLITEVAKKARIAKKHIYEVVLSGNTCMLHLAINKSPGSLGKYPYQSQIEGGVLLKSVDYNLDIAEFGVTYLPPIISSFVGADITSGLLACQLHHQNDTVLFVDIGTNGEMVLAVGGRLIASSTAAGPAFEGMNILHGMRAGKGAIDSFEIHKHGFRMTTIGDVEAIGICGSGLLDIVAELVTHGVIDKNGRLKDAGSKDVPQFIKERLVSIEGKTAFQLSEKVWLSQKDIRQVQLAKGAIRSGIEFLLAGAEISAQDVQRVLIAGSFGYHLRVKSLIELGLLPEEFSNKVQMVGNTSKSGGQAFLLNQSYRKEMKEIVKKVEVIELADYQDFDRVFVDCLGF